MTLWLIRPAARADEAVSANRAALNVTGLPDLGPFDSPAAVAHAL